MTQQHPCSKVEYELWANGHPFIKGIEDLTEAYTEARRNPDWQLVMVHTSRTPIPITPPKNRRVKVYHKRGEV